jgi:hypothetical protein
MRLPRVAARLAALLMPLAASAHGFDERYDLPAPLGWFVAGAALTVGLSLVLAILFARQAPALAHAGAVDDAPLSWPRPLRVLLGLSGLLLLAVNLAAALSGTADPMMNLAPGFVWIVWWVGLSLLVACIGDIWPLLDPWRTLFAMLDALMRRCGRPQGASLGLRWPAWLGAWPAVLLLLAWSWLEVVYPLAAVPARLGWAALLWTVVSLLGMVCFGREAWQRHADVFAISFALLGRMAPRLRRGPPRRWRLPGSALIDPQALAPSRLPGMTGFVIAMLSTVLFDGLHGGQAWLLLEQGLRRVAPGWMDANGYFAGTVGLVLVWLLVRLAFALACVITRPLVRGMSASALAWQLAPTLVPIAVAYNVAHNFSSLLIQGQHVLSLLSDPLGRGWNLLGTADSRVNIGLVDARFTWYVAIGAIVIGHIVAVWLAHRVLLRDCASPRQATLASLPLTVLMVAYTAVSLLVIAEPMVVFVPV